MKGFREILDTEQRLAICELLEQDPDYSHNEQVLKRAMDMYGHNVGTDLLRNHVTWLEEQGLVTIDKTTLPNLWIIKVTARGQDVALGRTQIPGVARPRP